MKRFLIISAAIFLLFCASSQIWANKLSAQFSGGAAYNFKLPAAIQQDGADNIRLNAEYDSDSFESPIYYSVRMGWWSDDHSWELEMVHHKLTLENRPPDVEHFAMTHGFNQLTLNRAWKNPLCILRLGAGIVITHPESTIRGRTFEQDGGIADGYFISGPTVQIAVEKRFTLYKGLFASIEGKYTLSWAHVPIKDGSADLWNSSVHGLLGVGFDF